MTERCYKDLLEVERLTPLQWELSYLDAKLGGIGLPQVKVEAVITRCAALLTAHNSASTSATVEHQRMTEREQLYALLQPHLEMPVMGYFNDLHQAPEGRNPRRVAKTVRAHVHTTLKRQVSNRLGDLTQSLMGIEYARTVVKGDQPMLGLCHRLWPSSAAMKIPDGYLRRTILRQLGFPVPGASGQCQRQLPTGEICGMQMDQAGHHAYLCARHLMRARHDGIRDHLAQYIRAAGLYCMTEQRTAGEIKLEEAPEMAAGEWKRPRRTADLHVVDRGGGDIYGDVRIYSMSPGESAEHTLKQQEAAKCAEYGLGPPPTPEPIHGVSPIVFELAGAVSKSCLGFCRQMIWQQVRKSMLQQAAEKGVAWRRAAHALWAPIAVLLLKTRCQAELACVNS